MRTSVLVALPVAGAGGARQRPTPIGATLRHPRDGGRSSRARGLGTILVACSCLLMAGCALPEGQRRFRLELEGGAAWQTRNDVAIPGDTGTRFALDDLTGSGPFPAWRLTLDTEIAPDHGLRVSAAPFEVSGTGELDQPVDFDGSTFATGTATEATWRFDTYRATYRYELLDDPRWSFRIGFTAAVRDAEVALKQAGLSERYTNTGFVPALHADASWQATPMLRLAAELDGAGASQGRLIDFALKGYWAVGGDIELGLGYRTIEGGADNDDVFTFAWIHQALLSVSVRF